MNRRQFTGGLTAAALYAAQARAAWVPGDARTPSMTELQQQFLDLHFGIYIHLN